MSCCFLSVILNLLLHTTVAQASNILLLDRVLPVVRPLPLQFIFTLQPEKELGVIALQVRSSAARQYRPGASAPHFIYTAAQASLSSGNFLY